MLKLRPRYKNDEPEHYEQKTPKSHPVEVENAAPKSKRLRIMDEEDERGNFPKERFLTKRNGGCAFICYKNVWFIAHTSDRGEVRPHALNAVVKCGLTSCNGVFFDKTVLIARIIVCAPEWNINYGKTVFACTEHFLESVDRGEDIDLREAADLLEAGPSNVARALFQDQDVTKWKAP